MAKPDPATTEFTHAPLLQRLAAFLPGSGKRGVRNEAIDELAEVARLYPTQGKLEALIDLRDRVGKKFDKFGKIPGVVGFIGFMSVLLGMEFAGGAGGAMLLAKSSDVAASLVTPAFAGLGIAAAGAVLGTYAIAKFVSLYKADGRVASLIAGEAKKVVEAKPDIPKDLSKRYASRLTKLFTKIAPYPASYDKQLAEKIAVKKAIAAAPAKVAYDALDL